MSELRRDPIRDHWVIVAPERAQRSSDLRPGQERASDDPEACPFCPGNEVVTPPEVARVEDARGWCVRVIRNEYPALREHGELQEGTTAGPYDRTSGTGAHEVVIETPDHWATLPDLSDEQVKAVIETYVARARDLMNDPRVRHVLVFKNQGQQAGATRCHSHSQIVASPVVPSATSASLNSAHVYHQRAGRCLFCDLMRHELETKERVILAEDEFVVLAPYASRTPYEVSIWPRAHSHDFTTMSENAQWVLACTLKDVLWRLRHLLGDIPFNYYFDTAPKLDPHLNEPSVLLQVAAEYHWRIMVVPRLTEIAGFELGTEDYINPVPPEVAARQLRAAADSGS